jgi:N-acetylglutamate synthase-like GNAT family acetyltransferase
LAEPPEVSIRVATAADIAAIVDLVESAYRGERSREGWTTEADLLDGQRTDPDEVGAIVRSSHSLILVGEVAGGAVGCCQLSARTEGSAYLGMLAVKPHVQGRGVGRAIMIEAERVARDTLSSNELQIMVIRQRDDVISWYGRLGYRRTGRTVPFPYGDQRKGIPRRSDLEFLVLAKYL